MALNVRQRIVLTLLTVVLVVAAVIAAGLVLMSGLEESVPADVGRKTERVFAVEGIESDFKRIDAAFRTALTGSFRTARQEHAEIWRGLDKKLADAEQNADPEEEEEFLIRLTRMAEDYRRQGDAFFARPESDPARNELYYGPHGLLATFQQLSKVASGCLGFEQVSMANSINQGHILVTNSLRSFEVMLVLTIVLAGLVAAYRIRKILRPDWPASRDEQGPGSALEPDFAGPLCLCSVAVWLAVICTWNSLPPRPLSRSVAALLTKRGKELYHPEYDIAIYMAGLAVSVLATVAWALVWHRRWQAASSEGRGDNISRLLKFYKWCALGCVGLACLYTNGRLLNAYCAVLAALATVLLWQETRRTSEVSLSSTPPTRGQRRASTVARARDGSRPDRSGPQKPATFPELSSVKDAVDPNPPHWLRSDRWGAIAATAIVALLVYIPDPGMLIARCWVERFHHWDFYLTGPFLGFQHGAALGSQCFTQYGVGWPVVVSVFSKFQPISYEWLMSSATVYGCVYFVFLFFFLRSLTGSTAWAFVGFLLSLFLQVFSGIDGPIWDTPSSSVLRAPFDVLVYWAALKHARSAAARWGGLIGGAAGLNLLFGSDTGIYVIAAVLFYGALCWGYRPRGKRLLNVPFALGTLIAMLATFLGGLAWASRGTCFRPGFWPRYWEAILLYSGGMSSLPMSVGIEGRQEFVLTIAVLTTYSFAIGNTVFRFLVRKLEASDLVMALVAASGLGLLILFINRSHPFNLYHPIVPFCILVTHYASRWTASRSTASSSTGTSRARGAESWRRTEAAPLAMIALLVVAFATNPYVRNYPSLLVNLVRSFGSEPRAVSGSAAPAKGGLAARVDYRKELRPLIDALRKLSDKGRHSVAVLAPNDTPLLLLTDMAPYFRYSPLQLIVHRQVAAVEQTLIDRPPEFILFCNEWPTEMRRSWEKFLAGRYHQESEAQEGWFIMRQIKPSS